MKKTALLLFIISVLSITACSSGETADNETVFQPSAPTDSVLDSVQSDNNPADDSSSEASQTEGSSAVDDDVYVDEINALFFYTPESLKEHIEETIDGHDYPYPEYDEGKYSFSEACFYELSHTYYLTLSDTDGNSVSIGAEVNGIHFDSYDQFYDMMTANVFEGEIEIIKCEDINGIFFSIFDHPDEYYFVGMDSYNMYYDFSYYPADKTNATPDEIRERLKDFAL